jgi:leucyl-tRNA synthetase
VLFDRGFVSTDEPYQKLVNQGMILGQVEFTGYQRENGDWISATDVRRGEDGRWLERTSREVLQPVSVPVESCEKQGESFVLSANPEVRLESRAHKMSKSRGNVVNPDMVVKEYGADALRLYEMFMGPLTATKPWNMDGVHGVRGFLDRVWRLIVDERSEELCVNSAIADIEPTVEQNRILHKTIKAVTEDFDSLSFNTAIARMMEFTNFFHKQDSRPKEAMEQLVLLLAPMAPHICEELWRLLGHTETLAYASWPLYDDSLIQEDTLEIPVQVKGRLRSKIRVAAGADAGTIESVARKDEKIAELLADREVVKVIVVPGRLVNFVTR